MKNAKGNKVKIGRLGVIFAITITMLITSAGTAIGTSFSLSNQLGLTGNRMSFSFEFMEPTLQSINIQGTDFSTISMPGCLSIGKQNGDPTMPVKPISLVLPPKKTISHITVVGTPVTVTLLSSTLIQKPVLPCQPSVPIGSAQPQEVILNTNIYSSAALYPSTTYSEYSIGYSHGYTICTINLNPVQYNPLQGTLVYYPELTVRLTLKPESANQLFRNNPDDASWVQKLVINPEITNQYNKMTMPTFEYPGGLCDPNGNYDYVIITTTQNGLDYWDTSGSLIYNWDSLLDHHNGDGLSGTLVTKQEIDACSDYQGSNPFNDVQAHIREFCKDAYEDWGTQYVLIGADGEWIPAREMDTNYETDIDADIYWSNLDLNFNADSDNYWGEEGDNGFDLYSDLFIGRLTCDTPQDVSNWMTKSLYYADSAEDTYLDNAAFYGGNTGWDCQGDDFIDYSAIKGTTNWLGPDPDHNGPFPAWAGFEYGFETWNAVNPGNTFDLSMKWTAEPPNAGGWQGGSETAAINGLKTAINNDQVTLISGIAHADPSMSLDVYDDDWESQYHNTKPFFIHDYGCHCGDFDDADDGILHSMLFHSDTELAFACVYNTCYGWGNLDCTNSSSAFQQKEFWDYFFDTDNNSGDLSNWQLGRGQAWSKDRMAATINWDYSDGTWRAIIQGCLLFGDPAQTIRTPHPSQSPVQPTQPVGPANGIWNQEYSYTSRATDPENDQIYYLFDWDDGTNSGWLGPFTSGQTVSASHTWTELDVYNVKVKARDIWGAGSSWSEPLVVTITDNTPPAVPEVTGPAEGSPGNLYLFNIDTEDPQGQNIYYYVDWGDETTTDWLGPYISGTQIHLMHAWDAEGTFTVNVKAKDTFGAESDWGTIEIIMPLGVNVGSTNQQMLPFLLFPSERMN